MQPRTLFLCILILLVLGGCAGAQLRPAVVDGGVRLVLHAPGVDTVAIAGSFNEWARQKDLLSGPDSRGDWSIILPLAPGRYEYLFLINGTTWLPDPSAPSVDDGFGGKNSVVFVDR